jgi:hypothetical protein
MGGAAGTFPCHCSPFLEDEAVVARKSQPQAISGGMDIPN